MEELVGYRSFTAYLGRSLVALGLRGVTGLSRCSCYGGIGGSWVLAEAILGRQRLTFGIEVILSGSRTCGKPHSTASRLKTKRQRCNILVHQFKISILGNILCFMPLLRRVSLVYSPT
jgi:hypothetical protein